MGEINQDLKSTMETPSLYFENFIQWDGMIISMKDNMVQENYKNKSFRITSDPDFTFIHILFYGFIQGTLQCNIW